VPLLVGCEMPERVSAPGIFHFRHQEAAPLIACAASGIWADRLPFPVLRVVASVLLAQTAIATVH
jgi:hypothetical protein